MCFKDELFNFGGFVALCLLLFAVCGCSATTSVLEGNEFPLLQIMRPLPEQPSCRVAVLPFVNESDYPQAGIIAYKVFLSEFTDWTYTWVAPEGEVHKLYQQFRIYPNKFPTLEQMKILASRLNAQLLIVGNIIDMDERPGRSYGVNPIIDMRIQIIDGRTAQTLWTTYNRRQGIDYKTAMHFGQINSVAGLCQTMSKEIITLWLEKGLEQCDNY